MDCLPSRCRPESTPPPTVKNAGGALLIGLACAPPESRRRRAGNRACPGSASSTGYGAHRVRSSRRAGPSCRQMRGRRDHPRGLPGIRVPVVHPLEQVPVHVVESPCIRSLKADWMRLPRNCCDTRSSHRGRRRSRRSTRRGRRTPTQPRWEGGIDSRPSARSASGGSAGRPPFAVRLSFQLGAEDIGADAFEASASAAAGRPCSMRCHVWRSSSSR